MLLPFAGDTAAQHLGGIATNDGVFLFKNAVKAAHGTHGCVGREDGSLCYHDMASKPDMMGDLNGAVGVAPIAVAAEKTMLVCVHECTAPRGLHMVVESNMVVADNEGRGSKVEMVAKGETPDWEEVKKNLLERDYIDSHREVSPLARAEDAFVLDNSDMTLKEEVVWTEGLIHGRFGILD